MSVYKNDNPEHLKLSIDSILNQTYQDFLLLVGIDGAVSEGLAEVLHGYEADARVKVFWFKEKSNVDHFIDTNMFNIKWAEAHQADQLKFTA